MEKLQTLLIANRGEVGPKSIITRSVRVTTSGILMG